MLNLSPDELTLILVPVTTGLVQVIKQADPKEKYNRFYPLLTEVVGFGLGMAAGIHWLLALTVGLASMGLYRGAKVSLKGE